MAKKRASEGTDLSKVNVKLKPVLGMQPGLYLTVLYAFILLLIIFLFLFLPGIRHWGSQVSVRTSPEGAAVYVDGRYVGATPQQVFITGGIHELSLKRPFYTTVDNKIDVGGRLFGSLFVPRHEKFSYQLELSDLPGLVKRSFLEFSKWALVDRLLPNYQMPPVLADTVSGALESTSFSGKADLYRLLESAMSDVHNHFLLSDFTTALSALAGSNAVSSPAKLLATLESSLKLEKNYPDLALWLAYSLPPQEQKQFESTQVFAQARAAYLKRLAEFKGSEGSGGGSVIRVDAMPFVFVPSGRYLMGAQRDSHPTVLDLSSANLPHIVKVGAFYMLSTEVTHAEFAQFVADNPKWAPSSAANLTKAGLATSSYLKGWDVSRGPNYPQSYVSYYAAQAFCAWLQKRLPASLAGYTVRLPSEAEWEWGARMNVNAAKSVFHDNYDDVQPAGSGAPNSFGIRDLLGNVWEWTSSWYLPASYFMSSADGGSSLSTNLVGDAAEIAVRGGSWASNRDSVSYTTRGSQPPDWCTPYLGFRPIIAKK